MDSDEHRPELDPAEVEPTDNSSGAPVDLDRVQEVEADLATGEPPRD
jgi:hypothetical protein